MIVGSIVLATDQGLGYLAKNFYDHGIIQKVVIKEHSTRYNHRDWYKPEDVLPAIEDLVMTCDALFFFEEVFFWHVIPMARGAGIKTVLMPMYECTRFPLPYEPDIIIAPSLLDLDVYPQAIHIPVPVEVTWKKRKRARTFVHNAGNGGIGGRNGTRELLEAIPHVKSPARFIIRSQTKLHIDADRPARNYNPYAALDDKRVEMSIGQFPRKALWDDGDVFVFPEKFNGLSLPLQEAYASGMLVMAGARYPMTQWLPNDPLIPVARYETQSISREFESAVYEPKAIAAKIDEWYDRDISAYSKLGLEYANKNSWQKLKDTYLEVLSR